MEVDFDYLKDHCPSTAIPIVFTNLSDDQTIVLLKDGLVKAHDQAFAIKS